MKRCPKCNRTYSLATQKFCTHDGTPLVTMESAGAETIRVDSPTLTGTPNQTIPPSSSSNSLDPYKTVIDHPQPSATTRDDPYKTVAERPQATIPPLAATQESRLPGSTGPTSGPAPPTITSLGQTKRQTPETAAALPPPTQTASRLVSAPTASSMPIEVPTVARVPVKSRAVRAASRPEKKSKLALVFGLLAVVFVLVISVISAAVYLAIKRSQAARRSITIATPEAPRRRVAERPPIAEEAPPNQSTAGPEQAPFIAPPNSIEFVNSKDNLNGKLAEHYADFSFYYPEDWVKDAAAGIPGSRNFVKVERRLPPDFTQESFAVGTYASTGAETRDREAYPRLMEAQNAEFAKTVPGYVRVSEGAAKVGVYNGYELRFQGLSRNTAKGDIKIWGRVVFLPPPGGGKNGVTLLMLATSLAPELKSVDDLGEKGELPMILKSFRFGTK
jgi:hypothetical protein